MGKWVWLSRLRSLRAGGGSIISAAASGGCPRVWEEKDREECGEVGLWRQWVAKGSGEGIRRRCVCTQCVHTLHTRGSTSVGPSVWRMSVGVRSAGLCWPWLNASHRRGKCACVTVSILPLYMYVASWPLCKFAVIFYHKKKTNTTYVRFSDYFDAETLRIYWMERRRRRSGCGEGEGGRGREGGRGSGMEERGKGRGRRGNW